jgi:hypothetical protein
MVGGLPSYLPTTRWQLDFYELFRLPLGKFRTRGYTHDLANPGALRQAMQSIAGSGECFPKAEIRFVFLTIPCLHLAGLLGGLHRASPIHYPGSCFTLHSLVQRYALRCVSRLDG